MTKYNTKTYQVDGLDWKKTPKNTTFEASRKLKSGQLEKYQTNLVDYMKNTYKKQVRFPDQPLLFVNMNQGRIYLLPEFCHEASLPDDFTKDSKKMRDIDEYKIKNPQERFDRITGLINKLYNHPEFSSWKIELDKEMSRVQGTVLNPPTLIFAGKNF